MQARGQWRGTLSHPSTRAQEASKACEHDCRPAKCSEHCARFCCFSDARPTAESRVYSVHPPGGLRVLWDNLLNDKKYADAIFPPLIARQVAGLKTGMTP